MRPLLPTLTSLREQVQAEPRTMLFEAVHAHDPAWKSTVLFAKPEVWVVAHGLGEIESALQAVQDGVASGMWAAGYLAYECGALWQPKMPAQQRTTDDPPLLCFGLYRTPSQHTLPVEHTGARGLTRFEASLSREGYRTQCETLQRYIAAGDVYQGNLTMEVCGAFTGTAASLFAHMQREQPGAYGAMLHADEGFLLSASPELFFKLEGRRVTTQPMKGTSVRGQTLEEDDRLALALAADPKNRAENVMVVDLLRNDLGRVAETGSVQVDDLLRVERLPSLLQMTSAVYAQLRPEVDFRALLAAVFPCGSITGAPKLRAMQVLHALEGRSRGVYTGAIGYLTPEHRSVFSVAIRTAVLQSGKVRMGVGSGVTAYSDADAEYEECLLKARFLLQPSFELIETMRFQDGECLLLEFHLDRLLASAEFFGFSVSRDDAHAAVQGEAAKLGPGVFRLRLTVGQTGAFRFSAAPLVKDDVPLVVELWPEPVHANDTWLRHKTTHRQVYDEAHRAARLAGCVDALFVNEQGNLTEGAIHSVFVRHGTRWRTPPLTAGVLPGVQRRYMLQALEGVHEEDVPAAELWTAHEILLTNAVRGVRAVRVRRSA